MKKRNTFTPSIKKVPPGPSARRWLNAHFEIAAPATYIKDFVWDRSLPAIGPFCQDPDGNTYLDFISHAGTNTLGYNHPEILKIATEVAKIDPDRYAGTDFVAAYGPDPKKSKIPTPTHLIEKLLEITKPFNFEMAFLSNSGAEAVENAIKICYAHRKNFGYAFTFFGAFHGRTLGALSLNRSKSPHRNWFPQIPNVMDFPYCTCKNGKCECGFTIAKILDPDIGLVKPEEVAYIIIEPIQGEGGYNVPDKKFMQEIHKIAKEHSIPLICDEVQSGMGRTGKWWASEHFGIKPDIITAGKSLRVAATIGKKELFPKESYRIASTWGGGNAIATAVGYKTIEIIQKEHLLENATKMGNHLLSELRKLQKKFPIIIDVRGIGLMDAIEFETKDKQSYFLSETTKNGLLMISCGYKSIRFLPPINVTKREIDLALEIIEKVLRKTA